MSSLEGLEFNISLRITVFPEQTLTFVSFGELELGVAHVGAGGTVTGAWRRQQGVLGRGPSCRDLQSPECWLGGWQSPCTVKGKQEVWIFI